MTIAFEVLQKWEKMPQDVMEWKHDPDAEVMELDNQDLVSLAELKRLKAQRRKVTVFLLISTAVCTGIVMTIFGIYEATRTRGMTLSFRNETLPVSLPAGKLQLRTAAALFSNRPHGIRLFSPFIASTQVKGEISVVTNYTNPSYHAFTVRHPEIDNVVMITDAFFCAPTTCFWLNDVHNEAFFKSTPRLYDFSNQLVKIPLPHGQHFVSAEYCASLFDRQCRIVTQTESGVYHFATVAQHELKDVPVIEEDGSVKFPGELTDEEMEVRAFRTLSEYERLAAWFDEKLAFISMDRVTGRYYVTLIDDVDYHEVVEIHGIANDVWAVLVMRQESDMRTKIRIYIVQDNTMIVRYDELTVFNRPAAINIVRRDNSFEICELAGMANLKCYTNLI